MPSGLKNTSPCIGSSPKTGIAAPGTSNPNAKRAIIDNFREFCNVIILIFQRNFYNYLGLIIVDSCPKIVSVIGNVSKASKISMVFIRYK